MAVMLSTCVNFTGYFQKKKNESDLIQPQGWYFELYSSNQLIEHRKMKNTDGSNT